uniref:Uncharacterized protein n=1 Tax=Macaca fascicularis TaxID=9541 RepID=A0A7N9CA17_MACFA
MMGACWRVVCRQEGLPSLRIAKRCWDPWCTHPIPWKINISSKMTSGPMLGCNGLLFSLRIVRNIYPCQFNNTGDSVYREREGEEERNRQSKPEKNPGFPPMNWICGCSRRTRKYSN